MNPTPTCKLIVESSLDERQQASVTVYIHNGNTSLRLNQFYIRYSSYFPTILSFKKINSSALRISHVNSCSLR